MGNLRGVLGKLTACARGVRVGCPGVQEEGQVGRRPRRRPEMSVMAERGKVGAGHRPAPRFSPFTFPAGSAARRTLERP